MQGHAFWRALQDLGDGGDSQVVVREGDRLYEVLAVEINADRFLVIEIGLEPVGFTNEICSMHLDCRGQWPECNGYRGRDRREFDFRT